jgi:hypothetical protein
VLKNSLWPRFNLKPKPKSNPNPKSNPDPNPVGLVKEEVTIQPTLLELSMDVLEGIADYVLPAFSSEELTEGNAL